MPATPSSASPSPSSSSAPSNAPSHAIPVAIAAIAVLFLVSLMLLALHFRRQNKKKTSAAQTRKGREVHAGETVSRTHPAALMITPAEGKGTPRFVHTPGTNMRIATRRADGAWEFADPRAPFTPAIIADAADAPPSVRNSAAAATLEPPPSRASNSPYSHASYEPGSTAVLLPPRPPPPPPPPRRGARRRRRRAPPTRRGARRRRRRTPPTCRGATRSRARPPRPGPGPHPRPSSPVLAPQLHRLLERLVPRPRWRRARAWDQSVPVPAAIARRAQSHSYIATARRVRVPRARVARAAHDPRARVACARAHADDARGAREGDRVARRARDTARVRARRPEPRLGVRGPGGAAGVLASCCLLTRLRYPSIHT
ncbi:hypothetical protein B0H10DRAFT_663399 [Mycena sp. CBHHK59/15]|nr:hypothetical protein B0H10DRAFT_663399 [Mycena sp. CBHHK59/15]